MIGWYKARHVRRMLILLGMSAVILASPPLTGAQTATPPQPYVVGPVADSLTVRRSVNPTAISPGQEGAVELRLNGQRNDACQGIPGRPVDLMIVFDVSASAGAGPGSNWEQTASLTQALVDHLAQPIYRSAAAAPEQSQVGLISTQTGTLGPEPVLLQALTADYSLLRNQVAGISPGGDTDLAAGLRMAVEDLAQVRSDRAQAVALMLHDNTAVDESTRVAVGEVRAQGIPIYLVVNSLNIPTEKQLTRAIGAEIVPDERIYLDPEPADLHTLFIAATEGDTDLAAAGIQVTEQFAPAGAVQVFEVRGPNGRIESGQVVWNGVDVELGDAVELSYRLRMAPDASGTVNVTGNLLWLDCNGYLQSSASGEPVDVEVAPASAAPAPTDTPPPGPTPSPTPDDGEIPIPVPDNGEVWAIFTSLIPWLPEWAWWLLLLLLLLLLLALLWWLLHRRRKPTSPPPAARPDRRPDRPPVRDIKTEPEKAGLAVLSDWRMPEEVADRNGRPLKLRIRPQAEDVEQMLNDGKPIALLVRVDDEHEQEIGRAEMTLELAEQSDPLTGQTERYRRARLDGFAVTESGQARGIEPLLLKRVEALSREHGARAVYGELDLGEARSFLEQGDYQVRRTPQGKDKLFKQLNPG